MTFHQHSISTMCCYWILYLPNIIFGHFCMTCSIWSKALLWLHSLFFFFLSFVICFPLHLCFHYLTTLSYLLPGLEFPWGPKPFAEVVAGPLLRNNRQTTDSSSLEGHYVGVYFSAHWVSAERRDEDFHFTGLLAPCLCEKKGHRQQSGAGRHRAASRDR